MSDIAETVEVTDTGSSILTKDITLSFCKSYKRYIIKNMAILVILVQKKSHSKICQ